MKINWTKEKIDQTKSDLLVVPFGLGGENSAYKAVVKLTGKKLGELAEAEGFNGQEDRTLIWQGRVKKRLLWILVIGMGKGYVGPSAWRNAIARAIGFATRHRLKSLAVFVDSADAERQVNEVRWTTEALILGAYRFQKYKSRVAKPGTPKQGEVGVFKQAIDEAACRKAVRQAKAAAAGVVMARDLVNEPANVLSPDELTKRALAMAEKKGLECTISNKEEIAGLGMNLFLAVAQGSARDPYLIHLVYRPKGKVTRKVVFVGKGITFDSGGLCIKPGKSMYDMKTDMAGAGAVLGIMSSLRALGPRVEVHGIIPATDNAINGNATRPGDVVKSLAGITVEILNTDAEGRLILADALTYAEKLKPDAIIDHATLTGACVVALGAQTAGLFSPSNEEAKHYLNGAKQAGELFWRLPLTKELNRDLRSDVADVKNIGNRSGGAITAALFLRRFVKKTPWIHLDIAGPARADRATPACPKGGTGFGVLSALEYLSTF